MAKIAAVDLRRLAVVGARARLMELRAEMASLVRAFPEIGRGSAVVAGSGTVAVRRGKPGRKTPMTAAERREVSERMKKYWELRRQQGGAVNGASASYKAKPASTDNT